MSDSGVYAGTPGAIYADTYLPGIDRVGDASWVVESINRGEIYACPRCHFLSLPQRPFPLGSLQIRNAEEGGYALPADNCDVCAFLPESCRFPVVPECLTDAMDSASAALEDARRARALTLLRLFMEQGNGADALLWHMIAQAREDARRLGATP